MLNIGIAGLGRMGQHHARVIAQRTPGASLVAACSPVADERQWAQRELGVNALYEDFGALLRDPNVDAVAIVTPTTLHAEQAIAALPEPLRIVVLLRDIEQLSTEEAAERLLGL